MLSAWSYVGGIAILGVLVVAAGASAHAVCRRFVRDWTGAPAVLAKVIVAIAFVVLVGEVLGSVGEFRRWPLLAVSVALTGVIGLALGLRGSSVQTTAAYQAPRRVELAIAGGVLALLLEPWIEAVRVSSREGMTNVDTLWYHLPAAAAFAQEGQITRLHYFGDAAHSFLPWTSELLHAVGMLAFHADLLSLVLNLGWAALALLAGWCIGRPFATAPASLVAIALVLAVPVMAHSQPASAKNDTAGLALFLAAVALLANGATKPPAVLLPAAAAGLAAGTRLNLLIPVLALTASVLLLAPRHRRLTTGVLWLGGLAATGSFWYVRNTVIAHNPLPWFRLGVGRFALPAASGPSSDCGNTKLSHHMTSVSGWKTIETYLAESLGSGWGLLLVLAGIGFLGALVRIRDRRLLLLLAAPALASAVAYVLTPGTGTIRVGCIGYDMRFLTPSLALALVALPIALPGPRRWTQLGVLVALAVAAILTVPTPTHKLPGAIGVGLLVAAASVARQRNLIGKRTVVAVVAACVIAAVVVGLPRSRRYLNDRYTMGATLVENLTPSYLLLRSTPGSRIAADGFGETYLLYGEKLQHHVEHAVLRGPRGTFQPISSCGEWQQWLANGSFGYVVLPERSGAPERWTNAIPGAERVLSAGNVVFKLPRLVPTREHCSTSASRRAVT